MLAIKKGHNLHCTQTASLPTLQLGRESVGESKCCLPEPKIKKEADMEMTRGRQNARRRSSSGNRSDAISPKSQVRPKRRHQAMSDSHHSGRVQKRPPRHRVSAANDVRPSKFIPPIERMQQLHRRCSSPSSASEPDWEAVLCRKSSSTREVCKPESLARIPRDSRYGSLVGAETVKWTRNSNVATDRTGLPIFESDLCPTAEVEGRIGGSEDARPLLSSILDNWVSHADLELAEPARRPSRDSKLPNYDRPSRTEGSVSTTSTSKFPLIAESTESIESPRYTSSSVTPMEALVQNQREQHRHSLDPSPCKYCEQEQRFLQECLEVQARSDAVYLKMEAQRRRIVNARRYLKARLKQFESRAPSATMAAVWTATCVGLWAGMVGCVTWAALIQSVGPLCVNTSPPRLPPGDDALTLRDDSFRFSSFSSGFASCLPRTMSGVFGMRNAWE